MVGSAPDQAAVGGGVEFEEERDRVGVGAIEEALAEDLSGGGCEAEDEAGGFADAHDAGCGEAGDGGEEVFGVEVGEVEGFALGVGPGGVGEVAFGASEAGEEAGDAEGFGGGAFAALDEECGEGVVGEGEVAEFGGVGVDDALAAEDAGIAELCGAAYVDELSASGVVEDFVEEVEWFDRDVGGWGVGVTAECEDEFFLVVLGEAVGDIGPAVDLAVSALDAVVVDHGVEVIGHDLHTTGEVLDLERRERSAGVPGHEGSVSFQWARS